MPKTFISIPIALMLSASAQAAVLPGSTAEGKKLHQANCVSCHDDSVYKRKERQVRNLEGLTKQINSCGHLGNITIGKTQVNDLIKYLNEMYYHFNK